MFNCIKVTTYSTSQNHCWKGLEINTSKVDYNRCTFTCFLGAIHCNKHCKFEPALWQQEPLIQSCRWQYFQQCRPQTLMASKEGAACSSSAAQERQVFRRSEACSACHLHFKVDHWGACKSPNPRALHTVPEPCSQHGNRSQFNQWLTYSQLILPPYMAPASARRPTEIF